MALEPQQAGMGRTLHSLMSKHNTNWTFKNKMAVKGGRGTEVTKLLG